MKSLLTGAFLFVGQFFTI